MSQPNTNPYAQFFPQGDFSKLLPQGASFDLKSWMETQQSNQQAVSDALHALVQGLQDIGRRGAEIVSEIAQEQAKSAKDAMSGESSTEQKIASTATQAQKLYERSITNIREIADMANSVNSEVADILSKRVSASFSEIKSLAEKASKDKGSNTKKAA